MTTTPRTRTLTAWQLAEMLRESAIRQQLGVRLIYSCAQAGTLERKPSGFDFVGAGVVVRHGKRRVYGIVNTGVNFEVYYGAAHPLCDVAWIEDETALEVQEMPTAPR